MLIPLPFPPSSCADLTFIGCVNFHISAMITATTTTMMIVATTGLTVFFTSAVHPFDGLGRTTVYYQNYHSRAHRSSTQSKEVFGIK